MSCKQSKKLRNIKPFNDFFFKSCFYHHLIAAYRHFGVDENIILSNYLSFLEFKKNTLSVKEIAVHSKNELEELTGVRVESKDVIDNIVEVIITSIDKGRPVIIAVDCFYLPYRQDHYKKTHIIHYLFIYGYDREKKHFFMLEHLYRNSIIYGKINISFDALEFAFSGYTKRFKKKHTCGFVEVRQLAKKDDIKIPDLYKKYSYYSHKLKDSLSGIKKFCDYLITLFNNKTNKQFLNKIRRDIHNVKNARIAQCIIFKRLYGDGQTADLLNRICECLLFINGSISKILIKSVIKEETITRAIARIDELVCLETKLSEIFLGRQYE